MRKSDLVLTIALLGSAAASMWLWSELQAERARNAELIARVASLPAPAAAQETTVAPIPVPSSPAVATSAANFSAATSQPTESSRRDDEHESQRQALQQPRYREAWRSQMRLNYARRRENVIRLLGFTPDEADAVIEIAIERQLTWMDRPLQKPRTDETAQQLQAIFQQNKLEDDAKLLALLGEEKRARLQEYMDSRNTRVQVDQLRPQFTGDEALRDDQVEPLIKALHVEHTRLRTEQQEYRTARSDDAPVDDQYYARELELIEAAHDRMHTAVAPVLSSSQLKRFDTLMKRDFERQKLEMRMMNGVTDENASDND